MALGIALSVDPPLWTEIPELLDGLLFCTDIHGAQRINPYDFGDTLTFHTSPEPWQCLGTAED